MSNDNEKKKEDDVEVEDVETVSEKGFGITEAPKDHPDNEGGNMKIIMG